MTIMQVDRNRNFRTATNSGATTRLGKIKASNRNSWPADSYAPFSDPGDGSSQVSLQQLWEALVECVPPSLPEGTTLNLMPPQGEGVWVARDYLSILSAFSELLAYAAKSTRSDGKMSLWLREIGGGRFHVGISSNKNSLGVSSVEDSYCLHDLAAAPSRAGLAIPCAAQKMIFRVGGDLRLRNYGDWGFTLYVLLPKVHCPPRASYRKDLPCYGGSCRHGETTWSF